MEASAKCFGSQCRVRSISLPSRVHPSSLKIETELNKLKKTAAFAASTSWSSDTIQDSLVGLAELYDCLEKFIHSPHTKQALLQHRNESAVEELLDGSIWLLDSCGILKDLLSLMKENVQELQSSLRRKGSGDLISAESDPITSYFCSAKKANKIMEKSLKVLKQMENKTESSLPLDINQHLLMVVRFLREVSSVTIVVFRSLLEFLSCSKTTKASRRWSLLAKLMLKSTIVCEMEQQVVVNEVECVDIALCSLRTKVDVNIAVKRLQKLDACIENFEVGVGCLFRRLIQSRASLLNIIAN